MFSMFFIKTEMAKRANFEEETWLEEGRLTSYSAFDEPVFFSKLNYKGLKMAYALRVRYKHLDAQAGHITRSKLESKRIRYYSIARNRTVYWYKFIWCYADGIIKKMSALLGGAYGTLNYTVLTMILNCHPKYWSAIKALFMGYVDAVKCIRETILCKECNRRKSGK